MQRCSCQFATGLEQSRRPGTGWACILQRRPTTPLIMAATHISLPIASRCPLPKSLARTLLLLCSVFACFLLASLFSYVVRYFQSGSGLSSLAESVPVVVADKDELRAAIVVSSDVIEVTWHIESIPNSSRDRVALFREGAVNPLVKRKTCSFLQKAHFRIRRLLLFSLRIRLVQTAWPSFLARALRPALTSCGSCLQTRLSQ